MGSDSVQGAGAPTMFQAMRRIVSCLANEYIGEGAFERAIRHSFLGAYQIYNFDFGASWTLRDSSVLTYVVPIFTYYIELACNSMQMHGCI